MKEKYDIGFSASNFDKIFGVFGPSDLVQISPACGSDTYQIMYGETLDFQCQCQ